LRDVFFINPLISVNFPFGSMQVAGCVFTLNIMLVYRIVL